MELLSALAAAAVPVAILYAAWRKAPLSLTLAVAMLASFVLGSVAGRLGGGGGALRVEAGPRGLALRRGPLGPALVRHRAVPPRGPVPPPVQRRVPDPPRADPRGPDRRGVGGGALSPRAGRARAPRS